MVTLDSDFTLNGKVALVTGASRGIGYYLSLELARRGAHIIAVARSLPGLEDIDDAIRTVNGSATLVPLDLHDMVAIDGLGAQINDRWGKLDVLVANAGTLGTIAPVTHVEAATFEDVICVNLVSQWRLIRSADPLLQQSKAGRALIISSGVAHTARAFWGPYAASKAALEVIARCWAEENKHNSLRINMVNPGATRTSMRAQAVPGEDPQTLPAPQDIARSIVRLASPNLTETGQLFDYREDRFMTIRPPE